MPKVSFYSQLLIIIFTIITFVIVNSNRQHGNLNQQNSLQTPKIARPNPKIEEKVELSPKSEVKSSSVALATYKTTPAFEQYRPRYTITTIHPSNYGERYSVDVNGNSVNNFPVVVLHETTDSVMSAINTFKTPHDNDSNQVSYHALISRDGTIIYLLPSDKRAFGAGNSAFESSLGLETVKTNPNLPSSVNNFAYHISLETPPDGRGKPHQKYHSGYTDSQYKSLAWLLALSNIPDNRITTHENVDRSGQKIDPRSFDFDKFFKILHTYRQPSLERMSAK